MRQWWLAWRDISPCVRVSSPGVRFVDPYSKPTLSYPRPLHIVDVEVCSRTAFRSFFAKSGPEIYAPPGAVLDASDGDGPLLEWQRFEVAYPRSRYVIRSLNQLWRLVGERKIIADVANTIDHSRNELCATYIIRFEIDLSTKEVYFAVRYCVEINSYLPHEIVNSAVLDSGVCYSGFLYNSNYFSIRQFHRFYNSLGEEKFCILVVNIYACEDFEAYAVASNKVNFYAIEAYLRLPAGSHKRTDSLALPSVSRPRASKRFPRLSNAISLSRLPLLNPIVEVGNNLEKSEHDNAECKCLCDDDQCPYRGRLNPLKKSSRSSIPDVIGSSRCRHGIPPSAPHEHVKRLRVRPATERWAA